MKKESEAVDTSTYILLSGSTPSDPAISKYLYFIVVFQCLIFFCILCCFSDFFLTSLFLMFSIKKVSILSFFDLKIFISSILF